MVAYERRMTQDVTIHNPARAFDGYTLFSPTFGRNCWIVDMAGRVCHFWTLPTAPASQGQLAHNGNLLWQGKGPGSNFDFVGAGTELVEYDWQGNELWRYNQPGLNHNFVELENGNFIVNVYKRLEDDFAANIQGGIPGSELRGHMWTCEIREINRAGETLWSWVVADHLDQETDVLCPLCPRHCWGFINGLDITPDGDLLVCLRLLNDIALVDRSTGRIKWRLGKDKELGHPHYPTALPDGNILVYDNGLHRRGANPNLQIADIAGSRVVEFSRDGKIAWKFQENPTPHFFSAICSSASRLPNGNTLICEATNGRFLEVTPDCEKVWEYHSPFVITRPDYWGWSKAVTVWAAHRYAPDSPQMTGRDLDPDKYEWVIQQKQK